MDQALIAEVLETARMLVRDVTETKAGEQVLVISDYKSDPITVNALAAASREAGAEVTITSMSPRAINGDPFTPLVGRAIGGADVVFAVASTDMLHSMSWGPGSKVRDIADRQWRLVEMAEATANVMVRPGARADYDEVGRIGAAVFEVVSKGERIRITSELGTDITGLIREGLSGSLSVGVNRGQAKEVGSWCCFPDGEVFVLATGCIGTNPGDAEGTVVFDTSMHMLGLLRDPIRCTVSEGKVTKIEGGWQAEELRRILDQVPNSNNIIELGSIATNPSCSPHGESMFEDRKTLGTIHIAVGNRYIDMYDENDQYRPHFVHLDGVISKPDVYIDGDQIIDRGRILCLD
jgi:leucyl aminopeptidase (aminopeptidase T)